MLSVRAARVYPRTPFFSRFSIPNQECTPKRPSTVITSTLGHNSELIKESDLEITMTIVMGTWCSDSRREVPRFYKILDLIEFPSNSIDLISVNREKTVPDGDISELEILFVPTFIFYREETEIGRIIEIPEKTLEKDFLGIIE